jgi:phosphatidylglycerol---prolipoprotein diacylglyceryl transferase
MYPPVSPIALQVGPLAVHWYGLTMTAAILLGTYVASRYVASRGQPPSTVWDMLLWVIIPAIVGARLYYVFIQSPRGPNGLGQYLANPIEILEVWRGGIHIYGALIFGGIALLLFVRQRKLPVFIYLDAVALGLLVGQVIGRLGNFFNQELYGPPTILPWGLHIDPAHRVPPYNNLSLYPESVRFQPLFLYEMVWNTIGFFLILWISRLFEKGLRDGDLFLLYLVWYPLGRFFLEFMRSDSWFFPGTPFDLVHLLSAISILGAATILFLRHRPNAANQLQGTQSTQPVQEARGDEGGRELQLTESNSTDANNTVTSAQVDGIAVDSAGGSA